MKFKLKRFAPIAVIIGMLYFGLFNHTPHGTECDSSISPDNRYIAERCLLRWMPGGNSEYVGRVSDRQTGKLLAQHTFSTPVPELQWFSYSDAYVSFSNGDGGDNSVYIELPPSLWDRLLASRPRLHWSESARS
jgi:hypothetical protein